MKGFARAALVVGLISFFFPYIIVSSSGFKAFGISGSEQQAMGIELMTTISFHEDLDFDETDSPDIYLILTFVLGIVAVIASSGNYKNDRGGMIISGACSLAGVLFLILFRSNYLQMFSAYRAGWFGMEMKFGLGWILSLATFACAGICFLVGQYLYGQKEQQTVTVSHSTSNDPPRMTMAESEVSKQTPVIKPFHVTETKNQGLDANDTSNTNIKKPEVTITYEADGKTIRKTIDDIPCLIGRDSSSCSIVIKDGKASRVHAGLTYTEKDEVQITDLDSSNGTVVNGKAINEPIELLSGDEVLIGDTLIKFEISG